MDKIDKNAPTAGWAAWVNTMPGTHPRRTLHVVGTVNTPTPCHEPKLVKDPGAVTTPEVFSLKVEYTVPKEKCGQQISHKGVKFDVDGFNGGKSFVVVRFNNGASISMPIEETS
jgi:hypothetical protein